MQCQYLKTEFFNKIEILGKNFNFWLTQLASQLCNLVFNPSKFRRTSALFFGRF